MRRRRWKVLAGCGLLSLSMGAVAGFLLRPDAAAATRCAGCLAGTPVRRALPAPVSETGHSRLGPPQPGDWRAHFDEPDQTFETYVAEAANVRCAHRTTFYLQPLGPVMLRQKAAMERMREYAQIYFDVPVRVMEAIPLPAEMWDHERDQYDAAALLDHLAGRLPADALVYAGIMDEDLRTEGLNFVFGLGSLARRTGVYSLKRYRTEDERLFLQRSLKLMSHEVGHIFSIEHCVAWSCSMQGANSLAEHDAHPMHLCPADLRKLEWNMGFDRAARYRKLLDFYRREGLAAEAEWVSERLKD